LLIMGRIDQEEGKGKPTPPWSRARFKTGNLCSF